MANRSHGMNEEDLQRLRQMLPTLNTSKASNVSQADIMHEAVRYIDHLQNSLVCHIRTHGYPEKLKGFKGGTSSNGHLRQRNADDSDSIKRTIESYITKGDRHNKRK